MYLTFITPSPVSYGVVSRHRTGTSRVRVTTVRAVPRRCVWAMCNNEGDQGDGVRIVDSVVPALEEDDDDKTGSKVENGTMGEEEEEEEEEGSGVNLKVTRTTVALSYIAFLVVSFGFGPSATFNDSEAWAHLRAFEISDLNMIFFSLFCLIGATSINNVILLNSGSTRQQKILPTELFTVPHIILGYLALAPYLILRRFVPSSSVTRQEVQRRGPLNTLLESRWTAVANVIQAVLSYAFGFGLFMKGSEIWHDMVFFSSLIDFVRSLSDDKLVYNSTVDFIFLTFFTWGPLTEDMRRRGWFLDAKQFESNLTAFVIMVTPALGPALYLALRPPLPDENENNDDTTDKNEVLGI